MQVFEPVAFQRPEVVGVSELAPELLEDFPIPIARGCPVGLLEVLAQMGLHAIIVDKRVVDVEQEDDFGRFAHRIPQPTFDGVGFPRTIPDRLTCPGAALQVFLPLPSNSFATSATRSGSNPYFRSSSLSGADAPNVFMPMTRPDLPT